MLILETTPASLFWVSATKQRYAANKISLLPNAKQSS